MIRFRVNILCSSFIWILFLSIITFLCFRVSAVLSPEIQKHISFIASNIPFTDHPPTTVREDQVNFNFISRQFLKPIPLTEENFVFIDQTKQTKYIIHGWLDKPNREWIWKLTQAYLYKGDFQVIQVDWSSVAHVGYPESAANTRGVGKILADHIIRTGVPPEQIHLIGHSLGAQVCGFAGRWIQEYYDGRNIMRITGLDPAGPLFEDKDSSERLDYTDASFVDITHSDILKSGFKSTTGSVDFFPNGGKGQPGCPKSYDRQNTTTPVYDFLVATVFCSHFKSLEIFTESINSRKYIATKCQQYPWYILGLCFHSEKVIYGDDVPFTTQGIFYFRTENARRSKCTKFIGHEDTIIYNCQ